MIGCYATRGVITGLGTLWAFWEPWAHGLGKGYTRVMRARTAGQGWIIGMRQHKLATFRLVGCVCQVHGCVRCTLASWRAVALSNGTWWGGDMVFDCVHTSGVQQLDICVSDRVGDVTDMRMRRAWRAHCEAVG